MEVGVFTDISGDQSCVSCWELKTGVMLKNFKNGSCSRNGLDVSKCQFVYAAQHQKQTIHVYSVQKDQIVRKIVCPEKISALAVSPDGFYLVVALLEKIYIWQINTGNLICVLCKHFQDIKGILFTKDARFFVTYGKDNLLLVWDFNKVLQSHANKSIGSDIAPLHVLSNHSMSIEDVHLGNCGSRCYIVSCSLDQTCKIMCTVAVVDAMEKKMFVGTSDGAIFSLNCFDRTVSREAECHVEETKLASFKGHKKKITCLSVTGDGLRLLSGSMDCNVKLWHIESQQCIRTFEFKETS